MVFWNELWMNHYHHIKKFNNLFNHQKQDIRQLRNGSSTFCQHKFSIHLGLSFPWGKSRTRFVINRHFFTEKTTSTNTSWAFPVLSSLYLEPRALNIKKKFPSRMLFIWSRHQTKSTSKKNTSDEQNSPSRRRYWLAVSPLFMRKRYVLHKLHPQ